MPMERSAAQAMMFMPCEAMSLMSVSLKRMRVSSGRESVASRKSLSTIQSASDPTRSRWTLDTCDVADSSSARSSSCRCSDSEICFSPSFSRAFSSASLRSASSSFSRLSARPERIPSSFCCRDSSSRSSSSRPSSPAVLPSSFRRTASISFPIFLLASSRLATIVVSPFTLLSAFAISASSDESLADLLATSRSRELHSPDSSRRYSSVLRCLRWVTATLSPRLRPQFRLTSANASCRASVRLLYSYLSRPENTELKEILPLSFTGTRSAWMCGERSSRWTMNERMFSSPNLPARTSYMSFAHSSISGCLLTALLSAPGVKSTT